ncbi:unnamed protein product, partial [Lymnaea stagnalis]
MANVCDENSELQSRKNELSSQNFPLQRTGVLLSSDHRTEEFPLQRTDVLLSSDHRTEQFPLQRTDVLLSSDHRTKRHNCGFENLTAWPSPSSNSDICITRSESATSHDGTSVQQVPSEECFLFSHEPPPLELGTDNSVTVQPQNDRSQTTSESQSLQPDDDNVTARLLLQPEDDSLTNRQLQPKDDNLTTRLLKQVDDNLAASGSQHVQPNTLKITTKEVQPLESEDDRLTSELNYLEPDNYKLTPSEPQASGTENHNLTSSEPQASETENHNLTYSEPQASETKNHILTPSEAHQEGHISLHGDLLPVEPKNCIFSSQSHSLEPEDQNCIKSEYHVLGSENNYLLEPENYGFITAQSHPLSMVDSKSQINTNKYNFPFGKLPELRIMLQKCDVPKACLRHMSANKTKGHGSAAGHEQVAMNGLTQPLEVLKLNNEPLLPVKRKVGRPRKYIREKLEGLEKAEADGRNKYQRMFNYQFKLRETDLEKIKEQSQFYDEFKLKDIDVIVKSPSEASNLRFENSPSTRKISNSKTAHVFDENTRNKEVKCINNDDMLKNVKLKKKRRGKKAKMDAGKNDTVRENACAVRKVKCHLNGENRGSESRPEHATTLCKVQADCAKPVPGKRPRGRPPKKGNKSKSSSGRMSTYDLVSGHSSKLKTKVKCHPKENDQKLDVRAECSPKRKVTVSLSQAVGAKKPKLSAKTTLQKLRKTKKRSKIHGRNTFTMDKSRKFHLRSVGEGRMLRSKNAPDAKAPVKKKGRFVSKKKANPEEAERCESPDYDPTSPIVEMDHDAEVDFETLFSLGMENFNRGGT